MSCAEDPYTLPAVVNTLDIYLILTETRSSSCQMLSVAHHQTYFINPLYSEMPNEELGV